MRVILGLDRPDAGTVLLGDPPVLMLDEPFNGMDPEGTREMRGFLRSLADQGRAVLVSSHLMSELEGTAASGDQILLRTTAPDRVTGLLGPAGVSVAATSPDALIIKGISAERIVATLSEHAIPFTEVSPQRVSLEQAYLDLTRDSVEYRATPPGQAKPTVLQHAPPSRGGRR